MSTGALSSINPTNPCTFSHTYPLPCPALQGFDVNLVTTDRVSALHEACLGGHVACAKVLLENGAQVSSGDAGWGVGAWSADFWMSDRPPVGQDQAVDGQKHLRQKRGKIKQFFVSVGEGFAFPQWMLGSPRYSILFSFCMWNVVTINRKGMRGAR